MKKNNVKNPVSNIAAVTILGVIWIAVKKMIKKYHSKQEFLF